LDASTGASSQETKNLSSCSIAETVGGERVGIGALGMASLGQKIGCRLARIPRATLAQDPARRLGGTQLERDIERAPADGPGEERDQAPGPPPALVRKAQYDQAEAKQDADDTVDAADVSIHGMRSDTDRGRGKGRGARGDCLERIRPANLVVSH